MRTTHRAASAYSASCGDENSRYRCRTAVVAGACASSGYATAAGRILDIACGHSPARRAGRQPDERRQGRARPPACFTTAACRPTVRWPVQPATYRLSPLPTGAGCRSGVTGDYASSRNAMSLVNVAYASRLNWAHPLLNRIEDQALIPLFGKEPVEMGLGGNEAQGRHAAARRKARYSDLVQKAFAGRCRSRIRSSTVCAPSRPSCARS